MKNRIVMSMIFISSLMVDADALQLELEDNYQEDDYAALHGNASHGNASHGNASHDNVSHQDTTYRKIQPKKIHKQYSLRKAHDKDKKFLSDKEKTKKFKELGCRYSHVMEIENPSRNDVSAYETSYYQTQQDYIDGLSDRYASFVRKQARAPMYLQWISPDVGYGIFAAQNIKKGDFIGVYSGTLRDVRANDPKETLDYAWYYTVDTRDHKKMVIDGDKNGNELRFINHAQHPNTVRIDIVVDGRFYACYIADRAIPKDAQLTVSYGEGYWSSRGVNPENF